MTTRAVVLTLAHREDRLRQFSASWAASRWAGVLGNPRPWYGVNGADCEIPDAWKEFRPGTFGCHMSHVGIINEAIWDQVDQLYVFEDDACFEPDSAHKLEAFLGAVPNTDALWLGGQHFGRDRVHNGVRTAEHVFRTHAYSLSLPTMEKILPGLIDACGHLDATFNNLLTDVDVFCPHPFLVGQAASRSDISGQHEPERWWRK